MVSQISGNFVNDVLEGDVTIYFTDNTMMKAFVHSGKAMKSSVLFRIIGLNQGSLLECINFNTFAAVSDQATYFASVYGKSLYFTSAEEAT